MTQVAKQVIVVRKDLNMRMGKVAAQVAHASLGAVLRLGKRDNQLSGFSFELYAVQNSPEYEWLSGPFTKICVYVNSKDELFGIQKAAADAKITHCLITDAGRTEFNGIPTETCIALGPDWSDRIDKITGGLPLL